MKKYGRWISACAILLCWSLAGFAAGQAAQTTQEVPAAEVVTRSVDAVGYVVGGGSSKVNMQGTDLMPQATGEAKVEIKNKAGRTNVEVDLKNMSSPSQLGAEFLTYVLWVVTPDGRTGNTGEVVIDKNGNGHLSATTPAQTFSLIITAEPYFAVRLPSEMVVLQSEIRKDTKGKVFPVKEYKLMKRTQYEQLGNPLALTPDLKNIPLEMYEARNSVEIAKSRDAEKYAPEIFTKAEASLKIAENQLAAKANRDTIISTSRQTVQFSEDARALAVQRSEAERIKKEHDAETAAKVAAAEAEAAAKAAEAKRQADAEAQHQAELATAKEEALRAKEEAARAEAEQARKAAQELRAQLLAQLNRILDTHDSPRGLVVNMADVLFDIGKYDLKPGTREKLAKLSGVILSHPGLNLAIEGHTDSTGSEELNQKLSKERAGAVRDYLVEQGLEQGSVTATGLGHTMPVADNSTAAGRQLNRRVEIIVSGEVIGQAIGAGTGTGN